MLTCPFNAELMFFCWPTIFLLYNIFLIGTICFNMSFNFTFWKFLNYILRVVDLRLLTHCLRVGQTSVSLEDLLVWGKDKLEMFAKVSNIYLVYLPLWNSLLTLVVLLVYDSVMVLFVFFPQMWGDSLFQY